MMAWEWWERAREDEDEDEEFLREEFTPATMATTEATRRRAATRDKRSFFLFLLVMVPEPLVIPAKACFSLDMVVWFESLRRRRRCRENEEDKGRVI